MGHNLSRPYGSKELESQLNDRQKRFIDFYLVSLDAKDAATKAGYSKKGAAVQGTKLLKHPVVSRIIGARQVAHAKKFDLKAEEALMQLYYCLTREAADFADEQGKLITDVSKLGIRARSCVDSIKQTNKVLYGPDGAPAGEMITTELKITPKIPAVDLAMKHLGLFPKETQKQAVEMVDWDSLHGEPDDAEKVNYIDEALGET
jgi:phage terminase small subunit